mgnify:CR=1 FL=1
MCTRTVPSGGRKKGGEWGGGGMHRCEHFIWEAAAVVCRGHGSRAHGSTDHNKIPKIGMSKADMIGMSKAAPRALMPVSVNSST